MDAAWIALGSQARIYDRMYLGGGVTVLRTGPKDAIVELHGLPLASYRYFCVAYCGYMRGLAGMLLERYYICITRARQSDAHTVALAGSWI
jgi:ribose/xylose/arabinose/galactoside ABC-type transport system permease subunit